MVVNTLFFVIPTQKESSVKNEFFLLYRRFLLRRNDKIGLFPYLLLKV